MKSLLLVTAAVAGLAVFTAGTAEASHCYGPGYGYRGGHSYGYGGPSYGYRSRGYRGWGYAPYASRRFGGFGYRGYRYGAPYYGGRRGTSFGFYYGR